MNDKMFTEYFITPENNNSQKYNEMIGPNGWLLFVACNSGIRFAKKVYDKYTKMLVEQGSNLTNIPILGTEDNPVTRVFDDSETCTRLLGHIAGSSAYVFQCIQENITENTVNENIQQLLQTIRTLRSHRARTITVIVPYMPYTRQDKPTFMKRESVTVKLLADQFKVAGTDIVLTYHPHALSLYGYLEPDMKLVALSGHELFIEIFKEWKNKKNVVTVSTDAGGAKLTIHYANSMNIAYAIANKYRITKDKSDFLGVIGDLSEKDTALIIDDETVTGGSVINTIKTLYTQYNIKQTYVGISHLKLRKEYIPRMIEAHKKYGLQAIHTTDTIPQSPEILELDFVKIHSISGMFAASINRLHYNKSVSSLFQCNR